MKVYDSPIVVQQNSPANLTIFGITLPQYSKRYDPINVNETIFIGLIKGNETTFSEMNTVTPPSIYKINETQKYLILQEVQIPKPIYKAFSNHYFIIYTPILIEKNTTLVLHFIEPYLLDYLSQTACMITAYNKTLNQNYNASEAICTLEKKIAKVKITANISEDTNFTLYLSTLPTPKGLCDFDVNSILIFIASSNDSQVLITTTKTLNKAIPLTFTFDTQYFSINDGQDIVVKKGTYTSNLPIKTSDNTRFLNNIQLKSLDTVFSLDPSLLQIYLGDSISYFKIGAPYDVMEGLYPLQYSKIETGFDEYYSTFPVIYFYLVNVPIGIEMPSSISVPRGGCSIPWTINLPATPYTGLEISLQIGDETAQSYLYVDPDLSWYRLIFSPSIQSRIIRLCSFPDIIPSLTESSINVFLGGVNYQSYYLYSTVFKVTFYNETNTEASAVIVNKTISKTNMSFIITAASSGILFWRNCKSSGANGTLNDIKQVIRAYSSSLVRMQNDISEIFSFQVLNYNTSTVITVDQLEPITTYRFEGFFVNNMQKLFSDGLNFTYQTQGIR